MDTETSALAFRTALNGIKNACPGISTIFILDENKQVITRDENTTKKVVDCSADSLDALKKKVCITGEVDSFTCAGSSQKINFTRYENNYLVTVSSRETNEEALTMLARVIVPSMLKLAQEVITSRKEGVAEKPNVRNPEPAPAPTPSPTPETVSTVTATPASSPVTTHLKPKPPTSNLPAAEFTVENLSGITIISSDPETVYVDRALLGEWKELYGDKHIELATVESFETSKKCRCRFQPIKSQKLEGKNVILIPDRIQKKLEIAKGTTVRIRPIVEEEEK